MLQFTTFSHLLFIILHWKQISLYGKGYSNNLVFSPPHANNHSQLITYQSLAHLLIIVSSNIQIGAPLSLHLWCYCDHEWDGGSSITFTLPSLRGWFPLDLLVTDAHALISSTHKPSVTFSPPPTLSLPYSSLPFHTSKGCFETKRGGLRDGACCGLFPSL